MSAGRAFVLVAAFASLVPVALGACRSEHEPVRPDPALAVPVVQASAGSAAGEGSPAPDDAHLRCVTHEDCALSCARGAVNAAWLAAWRRTHDDCEEGCVEEGHAARCEGDRCVALHEDGTLDRACTEVPLP